MPRPLLPNVLDGPLSKEQEDEIWQLLMAQPEMEAQPLTGWLLLSTSLWGDTRALSTQMASALRISHKTWEAGAPPRPTKLRQRIQSFGRYIDTVLAQSEPECATRRERAIQRTVRLVAEDPATPPCTFFHQSIGIASGDELEALAVHLDEISTAIVQQEKRREEAPSLIVAGAETAGQVRVGSIPPAPGLDPGFDALLMLMARMDRDCAAKVHEEHSISSLFGLLADASHPQIKHRARRRLLDIYYALAVVAAKRDLPETPPTVEEIERTLLGGPPPSGGQSWIVRWRAGTKQLRIEHVETISANTSQPGLDQLFRILWLVAQFWEAVEASGPEALRLAGARYRAWWGAMDSPGRREAPLTHAYWKHFQPHA